MCSSTIRNVQYADNAECKRMEETFSKRIRAKKLRLYYYGLRTIVMLVFSSLMFTWTIPPSSWFASAGSEFTLRIARAFYDTSIPGQIFIVVMFSAILWPLQQMCKDLYAICTIFWKRMVFRRRSA